MLLVLPKTRCLYSKSRESFLFSGDPFFRSNALQQRQFGERLEFFRRFSGLFRSPWRKNCSRVVVFCGMESVLTVERGA